MDRVPVRYANYLQTIDFHLFVAENADSGRGHSVQESSITAKLLVVASDEIDALRSEKLLQRFCCP